MNVDKHVVDYKRADKNHEFEVTSDENSISLSTDVRLALYENVEINEDDLIPVKEIMKIANPKAWLKPKPGLVGIIIALNNKK